MRVTVLQLSTDNMCLLISFADQRLDFAQPGNDSLSFGQIVSFNYAQKQ